MPGRPSPVDDWVRQLLDPATREMIDVAAKHGRRVQVVLFADDKGKLSTVKVTAS